MSKNQIRQNKATKEWIIYAPDRGDRPKDFKKRAITLENIYLNMMINVHSVQVMKR